ncbi:ATP/GTP-binding protein [Streptomyces sp. M10(2022)]
MSPRRNRPEAARVLPTAHPSWGAVRRGAGTQSWQGEEWYVRPVSGASAMGKRYRCPGCDQEIPSGVPHLVAWPEFGGIDDRRHWHKACWNAKDRRTTRVQRSRNAPRY